MLSDEDFINLVWMKYDNCISEYNKNNYIEKKHNISKFFSLVACFALAMIATISIAYTGVSVYNFIQKKANINTSFFENIGYNYLTDMTSVNENIDLFYKKVTTYDEYIEDCNKWDNLIEMSESDFDNSFLIIITGGNYNTISLNVTEVYTQDEILYINLEQTKEVDTNNKVLSLKLDNEYNKNEIVINLANYDITAEDGFIQLEELPEDYSAEQAVEDGCFVIENNKMISSENVLDNFISKSNDGEESFIRVADFADGSTIINDIIYEDGVYYINKYILLGGNKEIYYKKAENIVRYEYAEEVTYYLEDILGNQVSIGTII